MIGHYNKSMEIVMTELHTVANRLHYELRESGLAKIHRAGAGRVQLAIHPNESLAVGELAWPRREGGRQGAVQAPGYE